MSAPEPSKQRGKQADFVRWFGPLLDALRHLGGSAAPREALDRIADAEKVPESLRNEILKSGQERFYNQVHWARQYLVWEGLIDASRRGIWTLTAKGQQARLSPQHSREIFLKQVRRQALLRKAGSESDSLLKPVKEDATALAAQLDDDVGVQNFRTLLGGLSATGFEHLCTRLLRLAGFERVEVTGRSGDGGIDGVGVLQVNQLVSFKVVFQCKKWGQSVPPKEIRDLRGAMVGQAEKGIFLTTSTFSTQARAEAERPGAVPIELVDGEKLFEMFKQFELGLKPRTVFDIDFTFFEQFK